MASEGSSGPATSAAETAAEPAARPPFLVILSITITGIMGGTIINPAAPDIVRELHQPAAAVGILVAANTAPGIILAPLLGVLADRFGRRDVVVPCLTLVGLAGGLASFAPNFGVLLTLRVLQGVGGAGLINLGIVLIADSWQGHDRVRMIGRNAAVLTASVVVLPPLGGALATIGGWRLVFAPFWLALVVAAVVFVQLPRGTRQPTSVSRQLRATAPYLRTPTFLGAAIGGFLVFALIFGLFLTVIPLYLDQEFGLGAGVRGLVAALPAVTSTIGALTLNRLTTRFSGRKLVALSFALWVVAFAIIGGVNALAAVLIGSLVYGLGEGWLIPALQDAAAGVAPDSSRGTTVAIFVGCLRAGQTAGPVIGAVMTVGIGARATFLVAAGLAAALLAGTRLIVHPPRPVLAGPGQASVA